MQGSERSHPSFLFDVLDRGEPVVIDDTASSGQVDPSYVRAFGVRSLIALPLVADGQLRRTPPLEVPKSS